MINSLNKFQFILTYFYQILQFKIYNLGKKILIENQLEVV